MNDAAFDAERFARALQHQPQLLRLAARLLGDADAAEDAVGHALLQESRGRRRAAVPLLPFLRAAVRNMARKVQRAAATRQRHEQAAARDEAVPATDELAAREQLRRRVADAVLALAEPYRTTVALVWLEERSVAEVAQRLAVAEATIRVRLHRARDELRRRLDRDYGSRVAWGALVAWRWTEVAATAGAMAMKKVLAFAALALLVLGGGAWLAWPQDAAAPPTVLAVQAVVAEGTPLPAPAPASRDAVVAAPGAVALREQRVRCIDDRSAPIAGAEVRLLHMPYGSGVPDLVATSGADGVAVFADVPAAFYRIRAQHGARHFAPTVERDGGPLPSAPCDVVLEELWVGGLEMPGVEVRQHGWSYHGFKATQDGLAEKGWTDAWQRAHPGSTAVLFAMFRDPRRELADSIPVTVLWFGHDVARREVRMWPASQFPGPEAVDPASVPAIEWATVRVVLTDAADQPLPESQQAALQPRAQLWRVIDRSGQRKPDMGQTFLFPDGIAKLPCGEHELQLFDAATSQMQAVRRCTVARDTTELRLAVPSSDRIVRLRLRGLANAGYMLQAVHENGRKAMEFGNATGEHVLLLPAGLCTLTLHRGAGEQQETLEHTLTITAADEQAATWDVPPPR